MKHEISSHLADPFGSRPGTRVHRPTFVRFSLAAVLASVALGAVTTLVFAEGAPSTSNERGEGTLRVCADPNNLPFSNERRQGFENRLAELIADELGLEVSYTWWAQRRGFARNTLNAGLCDVIMGVPTTSEVGTTTRPYYRSCYVFVTRSADALDLADLDDPQLHKLSIGLHVIGDDFSNVPPAHALAARGIIDNVRGYSIYGDYSKPDPPRELIDALVRNEIDVAIAWGPLGGYFARKAKVPLRVTRIASLADGPLPMVFDISIAVRRADDALRRRLDDVIAARRSDIDALLAEYGVPTLREAHEVEPY